MRTILPQYARLVPDHAKRVFQGIIFDVYHWDQELFDGSTKTFEMLKRPDTIQVLAIKDDKLVVLNEEQPSFGRAFHSLPGGRHDVASETELDAAKREMLEETGMTFADWRLIDVQQPHTKIEWFVYLYVATDFLSQASQHLDAGEKIQIELVDLEQARELAARSLKGDLPRELLKQVNSVDELADLPEFSAS